MSFSTELSYEIILSLGDNLLVVRKGKFIQNSCRVFFCYLTNGLTEENKILQDDWVVAKVNVILKFSNMTQRHPPNFLISEAGAFVNSTDSHFEDVRFYTSRRQCDWAMTYVDALSAVNIKTTTDKGTSFFEFEYVDGDSDDDFVVDGPLTVRVTAKAKLDLPIMGWVKLCVAGYGADPGFLAVRDWTGRWLVGSSSRVSRMEYGFTDIKKALATSQANTILAMLQPRVHVIELMIQEAIMYELKDSYLREWVLEFCWMKSWIRDNLIVGVFIERLVHKIGSVIMKHLLERAVKESVLQIELPSLMKMEHRFSDVIVNSVQEWRAPSKMEHELRDVIGKLVLEIESIMQVEIENGRKRDLERKMMLVTRSWIGTGHWLSLLPKPVSEIEQVSSSKVERGLTEILEKFVLEIEPIMQMEMQHGFRDVIEKSVLELMSPIQIEHVIGDVKIYSVLQMESMSRYIIELGVWNVIQNLVLEIEPRSQMEMEHRHRDTIEYVKPEIELLKQMTQVLHGELSDIKRGLEWALGRGLLKVIVESDSEDTIRCLVDGVGSDHPCSSLVKECRQLLLKAEEVCLRHVPLKPNQVVQYFTQLPDQRGELGKILRDFCGAV